VTKKVVFRETSTLSAISQLRRKYPYAAALLAYVLVERLIKGYTLEHRKDAKYALVSTPSKNSLRQHKGKSLASLVMLSDDEFVKDVLCHITLGDVEEMLKLPQRRRSAADRNEVMHSNLYLKEETKLNRSDRHDKNIARFNRALKHLRWAIYRYTGGRLVEGKSSLLLAQPNSR
jgi:hypothetical protein